MTNAPSDEASATFKAFLKTYRVRADLTQEELAEGSGVSVRAISDMERGVAKSPQRRTIEALATPLALTDEELTHLQKIAKQGRVQPAATVLAAPAGIYDPPLVGALPPDLDDLTGRERDLDALRALTDDLRGDHRRSGHVAVLSGPPGTGKTSLAVRTAHDLADDFPDGQLFLKLRGMSSEPNDPADVLHLILRSLGVDAVQVPAELEHRASLCRSLLKDRATLIVLDDAANEAQVRPLLVGGQRCLTLVTSRQMLVGLERAGRLTLDVLEQHDAVALLASIVGPSRVTQERAAAIELVELCGRLPLALRIAGNRLASRPIWPLSRLTDQLRDRGRRLTTLTAGDLDVRSVFELSYRQLSPTAAAAFRRLSLVPAADFSDAAAMTLIEAPEEDVAVYLEELVDASLLQTSQDVGRYQFHDLLRVFATERLAQEEPPEAIEAAEGRLDRWLVRTATAAGRYFQPSGELTAPPVPTLSFDGPAGAGRWLEVETKNWFAALKRVAARGDHRKVIDLAEAMHWYSEIGGAAATWHGVFDLALKSALAIGSKRDEAVQRNYLSWVLSTLIGRVDDAVRMAEQALDVALEVGDLREQGWAKIYLLTARLRGGDLPDSPDLFDDLVALFDAAGYPLGLHLARSSRATHWSASGRFTEAAAEFETCVHYFRRPCDGPRTLVDDTNYAYLLLRSAQNLAALGELDDALGQGDEALDLFRAHGATMGQARALQAGGRFLRRRGEHANARERLSEALALFERIGHPQSQVDTLCELASLSDEAGDPVSARGERERALSLCDRLGSAEATKLRERLTERVNAS
ncbi:XRE family transcriptional regulator [Amycolatopsis sp. WAC 01376]|uniref:ATP-binding protein n=1 Tax=Amycolatopsis sp. WAC 01376 TaxID=2203195 RepID=UPI000F79C5A1|nr:XRE family transcriptional regulator [Amycolatopsis sp. WAC 01376]RSM58973.1 XRE family transcriptional regulator [Amycolatopsis sp. WAC 01376]